MTQHRWRTVAAELARGISEGMSLRTAKAQIAEQPDHIVRGMALQYALDQATDTCRARTRGAEQAAQWAAEDNARIAEQQAATAATASHWKRIAAESYAAHRKWLQQHNAELIENFAARIRIEWTAELLDSSFVLGDGSTATWGHASIEQHRERHGLFAANAVANTEGAARHLKAIELLDATGCASLAAALSRAAVAA